MAGGKNTSHFEIVPLIGSRKERMQRIADNEDPKNYRTANSVGQAVQQTKNYYRQRKSDYVFHLEKMLKKIQDRTDQLRFTLHQIEYVQQQIHEYKTDGLIHASKYCDSIVQEVLLPQKIRLIELKRAEHRYAITSKKNVKHYNLRKKPAGIIKRGFKWADESLPQKLTDYFVNSRLIYENQSEILRNFLQSKTCASKIVWRGKGRTLTTIFYELLVTENLIASSNYVAEAIETNMVSAKDTLRPVKTKRTVLNDLMPANLSRRSDVSDAIILGFQELLQKPNPIG